MPIQQGGIVRIIRDAPQTMPVADAPTLVRLAEPLTVTPYTGGSEERTYFSFGPGQAWAQTARILLGYQRRHGLNTVTGIITRWAPGCENDTGSYIAHVAARLGVAPDQAIDLTKAVTLAGLVEAIIRHENGQQPYAREVILAGIGMGLGST